jgi:hypothetical protein
MAVMLDHQPNDERENDEGNCALLSASKNKDAKPRTPFIRHKRLGR